MINVENKKVVAICNTKKKLAGSSQAMEPYAATICSKKLKQAEVTVNACVHDACMSANNRIVHIHPNSAELLDGGHRSQALKKRFFV